MKTWLVLLLALALSGCGADTVHVTLLTPIPVANPTRNLAETLLIQGGTSNAVVAAITGPSCKQMDLRAGFRAPGWNSRLFPVALNTEILNYNSFVLTNKISDNSSRPAGGTPLPSPFPASVYLNQKSELRQPIVIPVPKGVPGEIFVQGAIVEPADTDGSVTLNVNQEPCARLSTVISSVPIKSFIVYGATPVVTTTSGTVNLAVNVIQTVKPQQYGTSDPIGYAIPLVGPPPIDDSNSDLKCKNPNQPKSCSNRGLFQSMISLNVAEQVWIRQPPPPNDESISIRINVANGSTNLSDQGVFVIPKESPYLMSYKSGIWRHVLVEFYQGQITYDAPTGRVTQTLYLCNNPPSSFLAGAIPTLAKPAPTPVQNCNTPGTSYNFAIKNLGEGFN